MPELPEVETIRRYLENHIEGKEISSVEILEKRQFVGDPQKIIGSKVKKLYRKGKVLYWQLSNELFLNFHLKMSGEILYAKNKNKAIFENTIPKTHTNKVPNKFTRCIIYFADNSAIYFNDLRKFGWIKISQEPEVPKSIDVLSKEFTLKYLQNVLSATKKPIKTLLMDQEKMAGIGNIYANDALWEAKINPLRQPNSLRPIEVKKLYAGIKKIIKEGIRYKGSSSADEMYILPDGQKGQYQHHIKVYHKAGKSCLRNDKGIIKRIKQGGRSSFFCSKCQK